MTILHCSVMISLPDLYTFRLPRRIGEWPEHQRIGLCTAPDFHSALHGPNERGIWGRNKICSWRHAKLERIVNFRHEPA